LLLTAEEVLLLLRGLIKVFRFLYYSKQVYVVVARDRLLLRWLLMYGLCLTLRLTEEVVLVIVLLRHTPRVINWLLLRRWHREDIVVLRYDWLLLLENRGRLYLFFWLGEGLLLRRWFGLLLL